MELVDYYCTHTRPPPVCVLSEMSDSLYIFRTCHSDNKSYLLQRFPVRSVLLKFINQNICAFFFGLF
jgi:hypothetical protein